MYVGFGRASLRGTFEEKAPYVGDLEVRSILFLGDDEPIGLIALDLAEMSRAATHRIREAAANDFGIQPERLLIFYTHVHASPMKTDFPSNGPEAVGHRVAEALATARKAACQALVSCATANVGSKYSVNRRGYIPEAQGVITFWYGYQLREGKPDASHLWSEMRARWLGKSWKPEKKTPLLPFDCPVDPLVQAFRFSTASGETLGHILRFSAHPAIIHHGPGSCYGPDFPGFARKKLEAELGGTALYLSGPCGNLLTADFTPYELNLTGDKNVAQVNLGPSGFFSVRKRETVLKAAKQIGEGIATAALKAMRTSPAPAPLDKIDFISEQISLPMAKDMAEGYNPRRAKELLREFSNARDKGAGLPELKRLADRVNRAEWLKMMPSWYEPSDEERATRKFSVEIAVLKVSRQILIGLPGESFLETALWPRSHTIGCGLVVASFLNGSIGYIPTARDMDEGGYEPCAAMITREGETILRQAALEIITRLLQRTRETICIG